MGSYILLVISISASERNALPPGGQCDAGGRPEVGHHVPAPAKVGVGRVGSGLSRIRAHGAAPVDGSKLLGAWKTSGGHGRIHPEKLGKGW